jgi:Tol biopolymer transport system component
MMPGVIRYAGGMGILVLLLLVVAGMAAAKASSGPTLAYTKDGYSPAGEELLTTNPLATSSFLVYRHPNAHRSFGHLSWSGDGTRLAFASHGFGLGERIYTVSPNGGRLREIPDTTFGFSPVFSPDRGTIAFARHLHKERPGGNTYWSTSIWLVASRGGESRQLTPWRDGLLLSPSSFSPDGTSLLAESLPKRREHRPEIISVPLHGGPRSLVLKDGFEPSYSPDGTKIAFIRTHETGRLTPIGQYTVPGGDLFVADSDGSLATRLTFTPNRREVRPSWDPSGERLAFIQSPAKPTLLAQRRGIGSSVAEINADGSCRHRLLFTRGFAYREAVWQPGLGREAGRIEC